MIYFNGIKGKNYFEGWFFRVCGDGLNVALIPSVSVVKGSKRAYLQLNCNRFSRTLEYPFEDFRATDFEVTLGKNRFSSKGISFSDEEICLDLAFGPFLPLKSDIMGCFRFGTPCKHRIVSMRHAVNGSFQIRGRQGKLKDGIGYLEKDWGHSFPKSYCWLQCNDFEDGDSALFCAVADIGLPFRGLICSLCMGGEEYRFATYRFARIESLRRGEIILSQSKYRLRMVFEEGDSHPLLAPDRGRMAWTVKEDLSGTMEFELYENGKLLHRSSGKNAGIEWFNLKQSGAKDLQTNRGEPPEENTD